MFKKVSNVEDISDILLLPNKLRLLEEWESKYGDPLIESHYDLSNVPEDDQVALLMSKNSNNLDVSLVLLAMLRGFRMNKCLSQLDNVIFLNSTFPTFYDSMGSLN